MGNVLQNPKIVCWLVVRTCHYSDRKPGREPIAREPSQP
jgi:hypothetical protein